MNYQLSKNENFFPLLLFVGTPCANKQGEHLTYCLVLRPGLFQENVYSNSQMSKKIWIFLICKNTIVLCQEFVKEII